MVTNDGWNVSYHSGTGIDGVILHVFKCSTLSNEGISSVTYTLGAPSVGSFTLESVAKVGPVGAPSTSCSTEP